MALEKMKRYDAELKEFMLIHGRPNLYTDYIKFCADARKRRKLELIQQREARQQPRNNWYRAISYWRNSCCLFYRIYILQSRGG